MKKRQFASWINRLERTTMRPGEWDLYSYKGEISSDEGTLMHFLRMYDDKLLGSVSAETLLILANRHEMSWLPRRWTLDRVLRDHFGLGQKTLDKLLRRRGEKFKTTAGYLRGMEHEIVTGL